MNEKPIKLWIHTGSGHYIGSKVIVASKTRKSAESIIRENLDKAGLVDEPLDVVEAKFSNNSVVLFQDGNY